MSKDFLYHNAPLVEVIVEVRWNLLELRAIRGEVDPHYETVSQNLQRLLHEAGFTYVEELVPSDVPLELIPRRVTRRFRLGQNKWPLYQVGPGVFTVNITPPYNGWAEFREHVAKGLQYLHGSFPKNEDRIAYQHFELRYMDAFTARHGFNDNLQEFLREDLGLYISIRPDALKDMDVSERDISSSFEVSFPVYKTNSTYTSIKANTGRQNGERAAIVEFSARKSNIEDKEDCSTILHWLDDAHDIVRQLFHNLISNRLKEAMGPVREI